MTSLRLGSCVSSMLLLAACSQRPTESSYVVSGTVSGLAAGTVLHLANNESDVAVVQADGSFEFPTPIPANTTYLIAVASQPAGQSCTVTNGAGTVGSADVSNVAIVCAPQTYTLGGNATGIEASLHLMNAGETITLSQDGVFHFAASLTAGTIYNVTMGPTPAGSVCSLANSSGTIAAASVTNVAVTCSPEHYSVSGSIAGNAGGFYIQNNGGEAMEVSGTTFSFPGLLTSGSAYAITVPVQPPGQTCTVGGAASGTIQNANVTGITITCVTGSATVGGVVTGLNGSVTLGLASNGYLVVDRNGPFVFSTPLTAGDSYSVSVQQQPSGQRCTLSSNSQGTVSQTISNILVTCVPFLNFAISQSPNVVIGQPDLDSDTPGTQSNQFSDDVESVAVASNGVLLVTDYANDRIQGFNSVPTVNGASADFSIGQLDPNSAVQYTANTNTLSGPSSVSIDGSMVAVADDASHRVLIYRNGLSAPGGLMTPDIVLGQNGSFTAASPQGGCGPNSFDSPEHALLVNGMLIVSDSGNSRVLIWKSVPTTSNPPPPDIVLGQRDPNSCSSNNGPTAGNFGYPIGVWSDGTRLAVADPEANRILIWSRFPAVNNAAADVVLGAPDFFTSTGGTSATLFAGVTWVAGTANQLFAVDSGNNRVLIWNTFPTVSGAPADGILGQVANGGDVFSQSVEGPSASLMSEPYTVAVSGNQLFVSGGDNAGRVLIYNAQ